MIVCKKRRDGQTEKTGGRERERTGQRERVCESSEKGQLEVKANLILKDQHCK